MAFTVVTSYSCCMEYYPIVKTFHILTKCCLVQERTFILTRFWRLLLHFQWICRKFKKRGSTAHTHCTYTLWERDFLVTNDNVWLQNCHIIIFIFIYTTLNAHSDEKEKKNSKNIFLSLSLCKWMCWHRKWFEDFVGFYVFSIAFYRILLWRGGKGERGGKKICP